MADLVAPVIERVKTQVATLESRVSGAADLQLLAARDIAPARTPAAYVITLGDDADTLSTATGVTRQRITETIGVVLAHRVAGDPTGDRVTRDLVGLRDDVRAALVGWQPTGADEPLEYKLSRALRMPGDVIALQCNFLARWQLRATHA